MKRILVIFFLFANTIGFAQNGKYIIKGRIGKLNSPAVVILNNQSARTAVDTVSLKKGKFEFRGKTEEPFKASLLLYHNGFPASNAAQPPQGDKALGREVLPIIVEQGKIIIRAKDSLKNATITGSKLNNANQKLQQALKPTEEIRKKLQEFVRNSTTEEQKTEAFEKKYDELYEQYSAMQKKIMLDFIRENPDCWLCLDLIRQVGGYQPDVKEIEPLFKGLTENVRNTKSGKEFADNLVKLHNTTIGQIAPDFTQNDPNGNPVKLSDFRGKYLLIDFWASWCGPCRQENPNVVKTYNEFKDKNFTILGVSLDRENGREAWLKAIEKDQLTWNHVSDLKFWNNEVAKLYLIRAIPDNFLIGPDGKIIARGLRGEALRDKLAELLK